MDTFGLSINRRMANLDSRHLCHLKLRYFCIKFTFVDVLSSIICLELCFSECYPNQKGNVVNILSITLIECIHVESITQMRYRRFRSPSPRKGIEFVRE